MTHRNIVLTGLAALSAFVTIVSANRSIAENGQTTSPAVFRVTFDGETLPNWSGLDQPGVSREMLQTASENSSVVESQVIKIERNASQSPGSTSISTQLPVERLRGKRVLVRARIKAENVSQPPVAWNGVKCMLRIESPGKIDWPQKQNIHGTFDWQVIENVAVVDPQATDVRLILGLESVTGTVWFDEVSLQVVGAMRQRPEDANNELQNDTGKNVPVYKEHDRERLRGAMIGTNVGESDIRVLGGEWGSNHIRWQLLWGGFPNGPADTATAEEYRQWLEGQFRRLDSLLPVCEELGMLIVIDLHTPPGGRDKDSNMPLFQHRELQAEFVRAWEEIAARYKDNKAVWGYDLLNEPCEGIVSDGVMNWHQLATETAKRIRKIDPSRAIIIEPAPWGSPDALDWFEPLEGIENVVYSVHMYMPHSFTHQNVYNAVEPIMYPGEVDGKYWDKQQLLKTLAPVFRFQNDHGVHIYLGEFSAIRWAPGESARDYLRDCIEIFEANDWDWAYHAFREWDGWSVEHAGPKNATQRAVTPTDRQKLLLEYFQRCK